MIPISGAADSRALDAAVIDGLGVPGIALMEVASQGVARVIREHYATEARRGVLIVCGGGNNGGDGYGCARWLARDGFDIAVWPLSDASSGDAGTMRAAAEKAGVRFVRGLDDLDGPPGVLVDAVFGTGLSRPVEGRLATVLSDLKKLGGARTVAVDIPSGLHADTGAVMGPVCAADHTVTFGRHKPAFFTPGAVYCGAVECIDIGVHATDHATAWLTEPSDLTWPERPERTYKTRLGHLAVVAGSPEMAGAAVLTCLGAVRSGVGLVTLFTPSDALTRLQHLPASVMVRPMPIVDALREARSFDAVAVGPGLGGGDAVDSDVLDGLRALWTADRPAVFDADALHDFGTAGPHVVATPHPGEAGRLLGQTAADVQADRFGCAERLSERCTVVLKGRHSLVAQNTRVFVNPTGAPTLATAGSGDVLTGVIGGLLARGLDALDAARTGVWVHGRAGELLHAERAEGWIADDIAAAIPRAVGGAR